jgi:hypothetical protein
MRIPVLVVAVLAASGAACGGSNPSADNSNPSAGGSAPVIASFTASPSTVAPGAPATLDWIVSGATSVSIVPTGAGKVVGPPIFVRPTTTSVYTLNASNSVGVAQASVTVVVRESLISTVTVTLPTTSLSVGQASQATATLRDANGGVLSGPSVGWTTGSSSIAVVDANGLVRGTGTGTTTVSATSEGRRGFTQVSVTAQPAGPVMSVLLPSSILYVGQATRASAVLRDPAGNALTGRAIIWSSGNPSVATVEPSTGLVTAMGVGMASISATSEGVSGWETLTGKDGVVTGIAAIQDFLEQCPTTDPAYALITRDFELLVNGRPSTTQINCSGPMSTLPIDQLTDELIAWQALRTAYYMSQGTKGILPWTSMALYDWMSSNVDGINIKTTPGALYCCDHINGKRYISTSRLDELSRKFNRTWEGIGGTLRYFAHEMRHADPGAPMHVNGCHAWPLPTDPLGCDASYDLNNLGSYGLDYWLAWSWSTGYLNIGIGCSQEATAEEYARLEADGANVTRTSFVRGVPAFVVPMPPYGGPCVGTPLRSP